MDWFKTGKRVQGCILSLIINLHDAEYIMRNAELDESQTGIKTAGRNINNLRYIDDTTLMAESEEKPKSFFFFFFPNKPRSLYFLFLFFVVFIFIFIFLILIFTLFYFTILY